MTAQAAQESFVLPDLEEPHTEEDEALEPRKPNRGAIRGLVTWAAVGTLVVGGIITGLWIWRSRSAKAGMSVLGAVKMAKRKLGDSASAADIADEAYWSLYPDCPRNLDPKNDDHVECIELWFKVYEDALEVMPDPDPGTGASGGSGGDDDGGGAANEGPAQGSGPAARLDRFIDGLTEGEYNRTRAIIGPNFFDQLEKAADAGDDAAARAAITRTKTRIENLSTFEKMKKFGELKAALGPKLDQLAWIMD